MIEVKKIVERQKIWNKKKEIANSEEKTKKLVS